VKKLRKGLTVSHLMTLDVLENPYGGVKGGWQVKILLTVSHALPLDLKDINEIKSRNKIFY
jgi:hypothetical protein